jgi:2,3-bisphosphoglycerate-independent phosphoglycerate mutase
MTIIFDTAKGQVYVENPDPRAEGTKHEKIYYYDGSSNNEEEARRTVHQMKRMYELGKQHRSLEIRKVLGV